MTVSPILIAAVVFSQIATPTPVSITVTPTPTPPGASISTPTLTPQATPTGTLAFTATPTHTPTALPALALPAAVEVTYADTSIQHVTPELPVWNGRILYVKVDSLVLRKRDLDVEASSPILRWQWQWRDTCITLNGVVEVGSTIEYAYIPAALDAE